jgi:hypothetical protein
MKRMSFSCLWVGVVFLLPRLRDERGGPESTRPGEKFYAPAQATKTPCDSLPWQRLRSSVVGAAAARLEQKGHGGPAMPVKFKTTGCLFSIIASVVLTVALNLMLRACSG